ncbi:hypothetical protein, partial [Bacillus pseudomycoides]|uniref:hypothetical protein n=1 Tax=Bacillus pseudomycoides TaxID=64104 RepID=UPI000C011C30
FRDLVEMMEERSLSISHTTIMPRSASILELSYEEGFIFPLVELFSENFLMVTIRAKEDLK